MKIALYARVSTEEQTVSQQLDELRRISTREPEGPRAGRGNHPRLPDPGRECPDGTGPRYQRRSLGSVPHQQHNSAPNLISASDQQNWTNIGAAGINDGGAIVGTATKTSDGSSHGVMLIPNYITRDGNMVTGTNANVWVGQQICLTNYVSTNIPPSAITSYQWNIPGANGNTNTDTAISDYEPTQFNSNYTNLVTPTNYTTNNYCNFYWTGDATNLPVSCIEVIYGQTNTVTATLNVQKPGATISTTHGVIAVDAGSYDRIPVGTNLVIDPSTALHFGSVLPGATPGMKFGANASAFPAGSNGANNIIWNQLVNSDYIKITTATSSMTSTNSGGYDSGGIPDDYPYSYGNEADDSPGDESLQTNYASITRNFTATMYLMWQPSTSMVGGDKTMTVPLRSWQWHWSATATNGAPSAGWGLQSSSYPTATSDVDVTSPPIWTNEAPSAWQDSGSL